MIKSQVLLLDNFLCPYRFCTNYALSWLDKKDTYRKIFEKIVASSEYRKPLRQLRGMAKSPQYWKIKKEKIPNYLDKKMAHEIMAPCS